MPSTDLIQSGLLADYQYLENGGTSVVDSSGTSPSGVFSTTTPPTWVSQGVKCTTSDCYVTAPISPAAVQTCIALVKLPTGTPPTYMSIIGNSDGGSLQFWLTTQNQQLITNNNSYINAWFWAVGGNTCEAGLCMGSTAVIGWVTQTAANGGDTWCINGQKWSAGGADGTTGTRDGTIWMGGGSQGQSFGGGTLMRVCFYNRALTDAEMASNTAAFQTFGANIKGVLATDYDQVGTTNQISFEGDSLTFGFNVATPWPAAMTVTNDNYRRDNFGIYGQTLAKMAASGYSKIAPTYTPGAAKNIVTIMGGTNDLASTAPATLFSTLQGLVAKYVAQGWRVILIPVISNQTNDQLCVTYNNLIAGHNWGSSVQVVSTSSSPMAPLYGIGSYANQTYFQSDGVHPNQAGANLIAASVGPLVNSAYTVQTPTFTVSPTTATAGTNEAITATGTYTAWTSSTTFAVAGGSGASISGLTVSSATSASFTLHPGSVAGTLTISDSTDTATATITASAAPVTPVYPAVNDVRSGVMYGPTNNLTGTAHLPTASQVLTGVLVDATTGTVVLPTAGQVASGATFGPTGSLTGTILLPTVGQVQTGVTFGPGGTLTGTFAGGSSGTYPTAAQIAAAVLGATVDNQTLHDTLVLLRAVLAGTTNENNGTLQFRRSDGSTVALTIVHDALGNRTSSTVGTLS